MENSKEALIKAEICRKAPQPALCGVAFSKCAGGTFAAQAVPGRLQFFHNIYKFVQCICAVHTQFFIGEHHKIAVHSPCL